MRNRRRLIEVMAALVLLSAGTARAESDVPTAPVDQEVAVQETLTFDAAVQRAVERNPTSRVAAEELRRYRALVEQTRAASLPTLEGNFSYTRNSSQRVSNG